MKTLLLIIAWTWVAVPLSWGVYQSVQKSLPLFQGQSKSAILSRDVQSTNPNPEP